MKHVDTLKETLSRQNITMETFDVSTGSNKNGFGSNGQSQANWQELARQQQNAAWNTSGGYRVSDTPEISQRPLYQASTEHSMVDVHF
jgi:flagellar hook-length control protein FliK